MKKEDEVKKAQEKATKNAEIKAKYGEVFCLELTDGEKDYTFYLKKPTRYVLSPVMATINQDPVHAYEMLLDSCLIEEISDSKSILDNDDLFMSAFSQLDKIITLKKSTLTKL